ncbi:MAG: beta-galactosidase trimerization domain-containing protein [Lachnospiraceae bacterium]
MSTKFHNSRRCYLIDHHSPQPPIVPLNNLRIEEYEEFFETANIDSLMVYCKDHWGVTYYDSLVSGAQKHQGVKTDWISSIAEVLKRKEIEFVAYYCIEYDEGAARQFPQWRVIQPDGTPLVRADEFAKWSLCCYQTDYRKYCLQQLSEIVKNYAPDALFMDIFGASLCYCDNCKNKFFSQYHYHLPETQESILEHRTDILEFLNGNAEEFLLEIKQCLKDIDPSLAITVNFSCHYPKNIRDLLDYQFSEPLLKDNWFSSAYARDTAIDQYPILVPGEASQVYNYDSINEYMCDLSSIAAQGCRVGMYSGSQHIDGSLDFEEARRLGAVFTELEKMEPYLIDRVPMKSIGILQSDVSMTVNLPSLNPDAIIRMKLHNPHQTSILGAMQLAEHAKIPYQIIPESTATLNTLLSYDMILLPEVFVIQEPLVTALKDYVNNGGSIIASGQSGLWNADSSLRSVSSLSELYGIGSSKIHNEYAQNRWSAYIKNTNQVDFTGLLSCTTPPVSEYFVETTANHSSNVWLEFITPCVACNSQEWVNWWSPPPGADTNFPALTANQFGNGCSYYCAFDFFTMASIEKFHYTTDLFADILKQDNITPIIHNITNTPDMIRTAFFETEDSYIIHQISLLPKQFHGNAPFISGGKLQLQRSISEAFVVYPNTEKLTFTTQLHTTLVTVPQFSLQQIIVCKKSHVS